MEFDLFLDELMYMNVCVEISVYEFVDGVCIFVWMCFEWCIIVYARYGDEEFFRIVFRDSATVRVACVKFVKFCCDVV